MTSAESQPNLDTLSSTEKDLSRGVLQLATHEYREALRLDTQRGGYLQGVIIETPEPTKCFRMDSKKQYVGKDASINRQSLYLYVPEETNPDVWLEKIWIKHINQEGIEAMFEVDKNGARTYVKKSDLEAEAVEVLQLPFESEEVEELDIRPEDASISAIVQKQAAIRGLERFKQAITSQRFEHVPFYS